MELDEILNDRSSGSMAIARKIISYFSKRAQGKENTKKAAEKILRVHGAMVPVWNSLNIVFHSIDDGPDLGGYMKEYKLSAPKIELRPDEKTVISLSNSSYVTKVLISVWNENALKRVIILESKPGAEGRIMAETLEYHGLDTVLYPDEEVEACVAKADLGIFGCDAIIGDCFINKLGTGLTTQLLIESDRKALVISSDWKVLPTGLEGGCRSFLSSDNEICWPDESGNKVPVINGIFEKVKIRKGIEVVKVQDTPIPKRAHPALIEIGPS